MFDVVSFQRTTSSIILRSIPESFNLRDN